MAQPVCAFATQVIPRSEVKRSVHLQVRGPDGKSVKGLQADDFELSVDGIETPLLEFEEIDREGADSAVAGCARRLVLYISDNLDVREKFRARRAFASLISNLNLRRDWAAVYSNGALSGFTQDRGRLRELNSFFAEEVDRFGFGLPPSPPTLWRKRWPAGSPVPEPGRVKLDLRLLAEKGVRGRLSDTLSLLKALPEWKVLFYFGRDVPYRNEELERHDLGFGARILVDAGFTVFAFNPSETQDDGSRRLSTWAELTGGRAISEGGDLRSPVATVWRELNHAYRLVYRSPQRLDCRWHDLRIDLAGAGAASPPREIGYYDTVGAALSLTDRTFLTAALAPANFSDFPLEVAASMEPTDPSVSEIASTGTLKVALRFPFSVAARADAELGPEERFHQRFLFFLDVFDAQGASLGDFSSPAWFDLDSVQLKKALAELARLDQDIEVNRAAAPGYLLAIVVVGQNERLAARVLRLSDGKQH